MKRNEKDTAGQQIADLCQDHGISPKSPAEKSGVSHEEPVFRTFEELLLTEEEQEERRKEIEEDKSHWSSVVWYRPFVCEIISS